MTNREIYELSLAVLGEQSEQCDDYAERAPYLMALAVRELAAREARYRQAQTGEASEPCTVAVPLVDGEDFPLDERFAPAVTYRLAGMLTERENESFAACCFAHAEASVAEIMAQETPATLHPIATE